MPQFTGLKYTLSDKIHHNPYHVAVIRNHLTRQLVAVFPDIRDEIVLSFEELLPMSTDGKPTLFFSCCYRVPKHLTDWVSLNALAIMRQAVARISNRVFLGLPYCE